MVQVAIRNIGDDEYVADVTGLMPGFTYTTDLQPTAKLAEDAASGFCSWFENAPYGRVESIYYILAVPLTWPGPPPRSHPYSGLHVKIGRTNDLERRLANLKTGTNDLLIIHALEPGNAEIERLRHEQFASDRRRGEWFSCFPKLTRHIFQTWKRHNLLPREHQFEILKLAERIGICKSVRKSVLGGPPDMMNPSLNERWYGKVFVDLVYAMPDGTVPSRRKPTRHK